MLHPLCLAVLFLAGLDSTLAVKEADFRKCRDTPFCEKHRTPPADDSAAGGWRVEVASVSTSATGVWTARVLPPDQTQLPLELRVSMLSTVRHTRLEPPAFRAGIG